MHQMLQNSFKHIEIIIYFFSILLVATVIIATTVHQLILSNIYFVMYNIKHSQVGSYLIRFNVFFHNINFLEFSLI